MAGQLGSSVMGFIPSSTPVVLFLSTLPVVVQIGCSSFFYVNIMEQRLCCFKSLFLPVCPMLFPVVRDGSLSSLKPQFPYL